MLCRIEHHMKDAYLEVQYMRIINRVTSKLTHSTDSKACVSAVVSPPPCQYHPIRYACVRRCVIAVRMLGMTTKQTKYVTCDTGLHHTRKGLQ